MPLASAALIADVEIRRDHRGFGDATLCARVLNSHLARLELRARHHRAECIENSVFRFDHNGRWQIAIARLRHVARQPPGDVFGMVPLLDALDMSVRDALEGVPLLETPTSQTCHRQISVIAFD